MKLKNLLIISLFTVMIGGCTKVSEDVIPANAEITGISKEENTSVILETDTSVTVTSEITATEVTESTPTEDTFTEGNLGTETNGVTSISLSTYDVTLSVGKSQMPIVTMLPDRAADKSEIWTSSDSEIATVNELGNITAVSVGECTVTVTSVSNPDISAEVNVTVIEKSNDITYIDGILIVNKTYSLPEDYAPGINEDAQQAFDVMQADASDKGLNLYISSAFRSYEYQAGLYQRYVNKDGKTEADRYSARPGHSEHQTGLAFDLNTIDNSFADTDEGKWLAEHCHEYGFIIRYPADKENITGYLYEPWHIRYLGVDIATDVYNSGLCLEEYLGIDSVYSY